MSQKYLFNSSQMVLGSVILILSISSCWMLVVLEFLPSAVLMVRQVSLMSVFGVLKLLIIVRFLGLGFINVDFVS